MRLSHLIAAAIAVTSITAHTSAQTESDLVMSADTPPNIIVVLADDLGWADVGANGASLIDTPYIDQIGDEGVRLTSFYAGANVCTPSRAALLTGRYPIRSGMQHVIFPQSTDGLPQSEITIAELLRDAGYATAMVGKWHLGHTDEYWPTEHGFEDFYGVAYSNDMQPFDLYDGKTVVQSPVDQTELTANYAEAAARFIQAHADQPFFLYYAETFPHIPLFVPEHATGQSEAGEYGDVVEHMDWGIGQILTALDEASIADNTLIIVTSDNGPWFEGDSGAFRDRKGGTYDGAYRVPFLARWPAMIPAGVESDAMTMSIDFLPTFAALAGADVPNDRIIDGKNMLDVMRGGAQTPHELLFFYNGNDIAAVRSERFRLVLNAYYKSFYVPFEQFGTALLFDLERDPLERFSYVREHPDIMEQLMAAVTEMRAETEALVKPALDPLAPRDEGAPAGPQLSLDR